jgi:putative alpha-1,2-mannosidase
VTPGTGEYVLGSPLFTRATVTLSDGRKLVINAPKNSRDNIFVRDVTLNGKKLNLNFVTHEELTAGGTLEFDMSNEPAMERGTTPSARPYSMSTDDRQN